MVKNEERRVHELLLAYKLRHMIFILNKCNLKTKSFYQIENLWEGMSKSTYTHGYAQLTEDRPGNWCRHVHLNDYVN